MATYTCARCSGPVQLGTQKYNIWGREIHKPPCPPTQRFTITNATDQYPLHTDSYTYAMHALYNRAMQEGRADLIDRQTGHHLILTDNT